MTRLASTVALCLTASASAFAPASTHSAVQTSSSLNAFVIEEEIGAQNPVGFFDPLKLAEKGPYGSTEQNFAHYRGIEVKHGRVAMAATVGMLVQETSRFNAFVSPSANLKFADIPNGLGAIKAFPLEGWVQIVMVIGAHELLVKQRPSSDIPGDFGTGYLGRNMKDDDSKRRALSVEITNGRLAMLGILGMFASEVINGQVLSEINNGIKFAGSN